MKKILLVLASAVALVACSPAFCAFPTVEQVTDSVAQVVIAADAGDVVAATTIEVTIVDWVRERVLALLDGYPKIGAFLLLLTTLMPVLALLANKTTNPTDDWVLMLINKILQTVTYNTSTNQPDVLSWKQMLTNRPSMWSELLDRKVIHETYALRQKIKILT